MQQDRQGLNFGETLSVSSNSSVVPLNHREECYLALQQSCQSRTTRLQICSADQVLSADPDWDAISHVVMRNHLEASVFKDQFLLAAKRGATSRSALLEKIAEYRGNEIFMCIEKMSKSNGEERDYVRIDPRTQPGYVERKIKRPRKSKK